jgi:hypothetical protein
MQVTTNHVLLFVCPGKERFFVFKKHTSGRPSTSCPGLVAARTFPTTRSGSAGPAIRRRTAGGCTSGRVLQKRMRSRESRKASTSSCSCDLHEQRGTLNVDKKDPGRLMCPACDLRGRCGAGAKPGGRWRRCRCIAWKGGFTEGDFSNRFDYSSNITPSI